MRSSAIGPYPALVRADQANIAALAARAGSGVAADIMRDEHHEREMAGAGSEDGADGASSAVDDGRGVIARSGQDRVQAGRD